MGAHRKPKVATAPYRMNLRTLTGAAHDAIDAIVDARNARHGGRWSKEIVAAELLCDAIARDPDAPAEYVALRVALIAARKAPQ